jgi:hypothetical protein
MHENMDVETGQYLQRTDHHIPKGRIPNQVTICYLKLPSSHAVIHTVIDYGCGDSGYAAGTSGKSMLVEPQSLALTASQKKQFIICMKSLGLKVSVHPSQLRRGFGPTSSQIKSLEIDPRARSYNVKRDTEKTSAQIDEADEKVQTFFKGMLSPWTHFLLCLIDNPKTSKLVIGPSWFSWQKRDSTSMVSLAWNLEVRGDCVS